MPDVESAELLEAVFEADPGALAVIAGARLIFRMVNPAYHALLPAGRGDPLGQPYAEVWPEGQPGELSERIRAVINTGLPWDAGTEMLRYPDGAQRPVTVRIRPLVWKDEPAALLVIWDRREQEHSAQQAQEAAAEATRRSQELGAVLNALPDAVVIYDADGQVTTANQASYNLLGFDPVGMPRETLFQKLVVRRLDGRRASPAELPGSRALQGQRVDSMRLMLVDATGKPLQMLASAAPLVANGRTVGAVAMWSDITELTQRRNELEAIVQVAGVMRNTYVQEEMFPILLNQLKDLMHADGVSVLMADPATGELLVKAASGAWRSTIGLRLQPGEGISFTVMAEGQPYCNNNIQLDERLARHVFLGELNCGACVPLLVQGAAIGVLWLGRNTPLNDDEVRLLSTIADIAASSLYRARLFEQTQLRLERLSALHSIDMAITSSLDLQLTLNVLLDQVISQMAVDATDILLYDPAGHWLEFSAGRGFRMLSGRSMPHSLVDTPAGQVALERKTLMIPDLSQNEYPLEPWLPRQEGFQAYFAAPLIAKGQVKGVLELFHREPFYPDAEWMEFLETLAAQAAIALDGAELFTRLQRSNDELKQAYDATIEGWSRALELRDRETEGHSRRVTELAIRLARRLNISDEEIANYRRGVLLHDIGKMAIPDSILLKDGPLTAEEQEVMRMHPVYAYNLLKPITYLRSALDIPYSHHEWWDGGGYPRGLRGEEIPLSARIFAVIDVYDALTNERTYRPAWSKQRTLEYIRARAGTQFDPKVVDEFLRMQRGPGPASVYRVTF